MQSFNIKNTINKILVIYANIALTRKFAVFRVSENSGIYSWRIRPARKAELIVGDDSLVKTVIAFEQECARVVIGKRSFVGGGLISVAQEVIIGDDVMVAWGVTIIDHNSHSLIFSQREQDVKEYINGRKKWQRILIKKVLIGDKAWIGFNCIILKGVTIGEGAIVGAGSVVANDVEPWTIVAGNPAKVIREIPEDER